MKKVTLTDLNGKEIEVYFADDKTVKSAVHSDKYNVKIENVPTDTNWFDMTGGNADTEKLNEMDVNENSAWCGAGDESCGAKTKKNLYQKLSESFINKVKKSIIITGTNGKSTTTKLIGNLIEQKYTLLMLLYLYILRNKTNSKHVIF